MRDLMGQDHRQLRPVLHAGEQAGMDVYEAAAGREGVNARVPHDTDAVAKGPRLGDGDDPLGDLGEVGLQERVVPHRGFRLELLRIGLRHLLLTGSGDSRHASIPLDSISEVESSRRTAGDDGRDKTEGNADEYLA
jgi:hypothetical protein